MSENRPKKHLTLYIRARLLCESPSEQHAVAELYMDLPPTPMAGDLRLSGAAEFVYLNDAGPTYSRPGVLPGVYGSRRAGGTDPALTKVRGRCELCGSAGSDLQWSIARIQTRLRETEASGRHTVDLGTRE